MACAPLRNLISSSSGYMDQGAGVLFLGRTEHIGNRSIGFAGKSKNILYVTDCGGI